MLEITPSRPEEWPACKALWQMAFGDSDEYVNNYYVNQYTPGGVLLLRDEEGIASMLALFELEQCWGDGGVTRGAYLYALATHPRAKGRGYAGFLMAYADFYLQRQGISFLSTVPARPELEGFFAKNGFQPCHPIWEYAGTIPQGLPAPRGLAALVDGEHYRGLREMLLTGRPHARYSAAYLDYQAKVCALSAGGLYRLETAGGHACAVAVQEGDRLHISELLAPEGHWAEALAALLVRHPAKQCLLRCPGGKGGPGGIAPRLFGMAKRIPPSPTPLEESYFSLAFD